MDIEQLLDQGAFDAAMNASSPSAANPFATMADVGASDEWSEVLANGNRSGGSDPTMDIGDVFRSSGINTIGFVATGTPLTGFQYGILGDVSATIKVGESITITGTANNNGTHIITEAEVYFTGSENVTYFKFAGIAVDTATGTVTSPLGALTIDLNAPDYYAPNTPVDGRMVISNDLGGGFTKSWFEFDQRYNQMGHGSAFVVSLSSPTNAGVTYGTSFFAFPNYTFNTVNEDSIFMTVGDSGFTRQGTISIRENLTGPTITSPFLQYPVNIVSRSTTINQNLIGSAVIGMNGGIAKTNYTTYVNQVGFNAGLAGEMRLVHTPNAADFVATLQAKTGTIALLSDIAGGGATNLAIANRTGTTLDITSSTGTDVTVPQASITEAGLLIATDKVKLNNLSGTNTGDQTSIVGITGTKAQFDTACTDGNFMYIGDAPTAHTHLLAAGATDVTATAAEVNLLDLAGLTAGWVLSADSATTASWKAPAVVDSGETYVVTNPLSNTDRAISWASGNLNQTRHTLVTLIEDLQTAGIIS